MAGWLVLENGNGSIEAQDSRETANYKISICNIRLGTKLRSSNDLFFFFGCASFAPARKLHFFRSFCFYSILEFCAKFFLCDFIFVFRGDGI